MAAPTCGLTLVKDMSYRGVAGEEWSNHYLFTGSTPADSTAWRALFDALVLQEKTLYHSGVRVVAGYGYDQPYSDGVSAVYSIDMRVAPNTPVVGTFSMGTSHQGSGDTAGWIRWGLNRFNSKGKRVYLRKYIHPAAISTSDGDPLSATWITALSAFGAKLEDGSFIDGRKITDRLGTALVGHAVSQYATTRTLKRRGKRPPP